MRRLSMLFVAVVGFAAPAQAAPIELVDPQDPANYVPVTLVATPLDAVKISVAMSGATPPFEQVLSATAPETTFWLNRANLRFQPQLRGWFFDRTTWFQTAGGVLLDLRPEMGAQAITLTPSTEPFNGDLEVPLGAVNRYWTIDDGTPREILMRAFITPEPSAGALAVLGLIGLPRRYRHVSRP